MSKFLLLVAFQFQVPNPVGFVNDFAGVIDQSTEQQINALIQEVRQKSGGEIVVVTLEDLQNRPSIDAALQIGRQWGVGAQSEAGDRASNAGVVLLLKPGERPGDGAADLAIATGRGSEGFITDSRAGRIRDAIGRESVQTDDYGAGMLLGVQLLASAYADEFGFELTGAVALPAERSRKRPGGFPFGALILFFIIFALLGRRRGGILQWVLLGHLLGGGFRSSGWHSSGGGWGGGFGGGGFGGFGGGGGFSGGGASGSF